ncbi:uncharacterized protein SOCG_01240 [Schizosaccharomyces octosporus yFS286]|uniref:Uncharacterized protein n=1 Tax=Schizosaccharomyces octosporus (strain yFS286) TaxID=483514 RepID=S9RA63_SCHOY|nr:uncharacterized protein SOCG_01240 [Schizosaccharomyces octosporus yFS286]EPX71019.1 hypothetical protein SOCG_01240 [Schizosaccharomyces octosporus yFS286]
MKNKYSPVSDSDESFKTLIDEKSDIHSSEVTPPPYSAPNKFIDLEMADGSAQHSAQESTNITGSNSTYSKWVSANISFFCVSWVPVRAQDFWGLFGGFIGAISLFLYSISLIPKEWFKQTGRVLSYLFTQICSVLSNMCVAVICTASLNAPCYSVYYFVKKVIGFEKMDKGFFYFVCIVNVAVFVLFWSTDTRQLRIFIADLGNGMGNMVNAIGNGAVVIGNGADVIGNGADVIGNGIRNAANYFHPENEAPRNEEIELQPLAEQSAEV